MTYSKEVTQWVTSNLLVYGVHANLMRDKNKWENNFLFNRGWYVNLFLRIIVINLNRYWNNVDIILVSQISS